MSATMGRRSQPVIAIDGPAGAGKSTLARHLARCFGFLNLETGAMYRALALKALEQNVSADDEAALMRLAATTAIVLEPRPTEGNRVLLDNRDVTVRIREIDVTELASRVSVHPQVRAWMVARQRALGQAGGIIMEGRDIGTKVFPDAELKIFLDASDEVRGQRRFLQETGTPQQCSQEAVLATVRERDARDRSRAASPLEPAADAVHLDSTAMTLEEVCHRAEQLVRERVQAMQS